MAGNNSIQLLRGNTSAIAACTAVSLAGQPLYDIEAHVLYVGDGVTPINQLPPISGGSDLTFNESFSVSNNSVSLNGATQTTLGGIKAWVSSGVLYISTEV